MSQEGLGWAEFQVFKFFFSILETVTFKIGHLSDESEPKTLATMPETLQIPFILYVFCSSMYLTQISPDFAHSSILR